MIEIAVQDELGAETAPLLRTLQRSCDRLGVPRATMGLLVVSPGRMAEINGRHRGRQAPTDVLSFPVDGLDLGEWPADGPPPELGDVVLCPDAATDPSTTLVVHGLLHLLGYDHETDEGQMLALQDQLVAAETDRQ